MSGALTKISVEMRRGVAALLVVPPGNPPTGGWPLTVALHGWSESAESFAQVLAPAIERGGRAWLIPNGPLPFEKRRERGIGYAWYLFAGDQALMRASMGEATAMLSALIGAAVNESDGTINGEAVTLLGFSQGGYLAGVSWMDMPGVVGVVCIGGRLKAEWWPRKDGRRVRFLQLHGGSDSSVASELAGKGVEEARALGYEAEMAVFEGAGHEVSAAMLKRYLDWEGR